MLASSATLSRSPTRSHASAGLTLPVRPYELAEAEARHAEASAALKKAREAYDALVGSRLPIEDRDVRLARLLLRRDELLTAESDAARNLKDARLRFVEQVSMKVTPLINDICAEAIGNLERAEELVRVLQVFAADVNKAGVQFRNPQIENAASLARKLGEMRDALTTPART